MKRSTPRSLWLTLSLLLLAAVLLLHGTAPTSAAPDGMRAAWDNARRAGAYRFTADILQTTIPLPTVTNVGRQSEQDALYVEGHTDLSKESLDLTVWSQGGSLLRAEDGLQVRVEGGQAWARQGAGAWEEMDDFTGLFAPQGDALAYLVAARDVVDEGTETRAGISFTRYTFRVDGPRFAAYVRGQLERQMAERGELPPGATVDLPRLYAEMTGQGELWVGEDGLPLRQILHLQFPEARDKRVEAEVDATFSDFGAGAVQALPQSLITHLSSQQTLVQGGALALALALLVLTMIFRRSKKVYAALILAVTLSMVVTPLLQSSQAAALGERQAARAREQEQRLQEAHWARDLELSLSTVAAPSLPASPEALAYIRGDDGTDGDRDGQTDVAEMFLGSTPPVSRWGTTASGAAQDPVEPEARGGGDGDGDGLSDDDERLWGSDPLLPDTDGDGLTDYEEVLLGTDPIYADSDGDLITDTLELTAYQYINESGVVTEFYGDPLQPDGNRDGIVDSLEWNPGGERPGGKPADTDGDGVPDIVDQDNDGDGVPDKLDLSPFQSSGAGRVFDGENPFSLIVDNLEPGMPTYVEFQVRPTDIEHLWYAFNVLDWPQDRQGQIQDGDGATYADMSDQGGDTAAAGTNSNGDVKLVPMLEIVIPGGSVNLPPESALRKLYGVYVQDTAALGMGVGKILYVPLQLVTDPVSGARVAFTGKMFYLPGESWAEAHQVRLVWVVQALLDVCAEGGWKDGQCTEFDPTRSNQPQVIQRYDEQWVLTGLNVREDHGQQTGIIWEDPARDTAPDDDEALFLLSEVLDGTFLSGRDCDTLSADRRCQGDGDRDINVSALSRRLSQSDDLEGRWNLPDILAMETFTHTHQDEALLSLVLTDTRQILKDNFTDYWRANGPITPTLLIVREEEFRANNLDALTAGDGLPWGGEKGRELRVDMDAAGIQPITMASVTWKPYRYAESTGWENCPVETYWAELERRYLDLFAGEGDAENARAKLFFLQFYYLTGYSGVSEIVQRGDLPRVSALDSSPDASLAQDILDQAGGAVKSIVNNLDYATAFYGSALKELVGRKGLYSLPATDLNPETLKAIGEIDRLRLESGSGRSRSNAVWARDAIPDQPLKSEKSSGFDAATIFGLGLTVVNVALLLADFYSDSEEVKVAATASTYSVAVVGLGMGALEIYQSVKLVGTMVESGMTRTSALCASSEVSGASKVAAKVGLIVSIGITAVFFVAGLVQALDAGANGVQIQMMVAQAIAQIIMAVLMFVLAATIIGNIVVAVIIIFDTIMSLVGLEDYTTAALLAKALYGYSLIAEPNCDMGQSTRAFTGPGRGIVAGKSMVITQTLTATAQMKDPDDWRAEPYLTTLWTEGHLSGSDVRCELDTESREIPAGSTLWERIVHDHTYRGWSMHRAEADAVDNIRVELQAGINFQPPVFLNMGYEVPVANCWLIGLLIPPICYATSIDDHHSTDLGALMSMDVLPATVEEFYWWDELGIQQDHDGDGLRAIAVNGNDPDDSAWDADGDGLSDAYELERRSRGGQQAGARPSLLSKDTDGDGLSDADEIRLGTFPNKRDSDGDGLKDSQEVFYYDANERAWTGGWQYSYKLTTEQGATETRTIRVTSDPLSVDTDADGLNDGVERALGENPRAWTPNPQRLQVEIGDADGIVGPGQTLAYTATLENRIQMDPGYFLTGTLTTALPGALAGAVLTRPYNLYQGESMSVVLALTVPGDAGSGEATIASQARGWMHDGYITDTYRLAPDPATLLTSIPVTGPVYANVAASPGAGDLFAVAAVQGSEAVNLRSANRLFAQPADLRGNQGCGPGVGQFAPGVACTNDGTCLTTWSNTRYHDKDNTLSLKQVVVMFECDGSACVQPKSEFVIKVNGTEVWSRSVANRGTFTADTSVQFDDKAVVEVWEDDAGLDADDWVGGHTLTPCHVGQRWRRATDCECKHPAADAPDEDNNWDYARHPQNFYDDCDCDPSDDGLVWIEYDVVTHLWDGIYGALNDHRSPSQQPLFEAAGLKQDRLRPAVASDGAHFLVVWQQDSPAITATQAFSEPANVAVYASQVFSDGTPGAESRLDAPGPGDDTGPAVAWAGAGRYIVVWHSSALGGIQVAAVSSDGHYVEDSRRTLASDATQAQVAANPDTGQALAVYIKECDSGSCIKGHLVDLAAGAGLTGTIGAEIDIADGVQVAGAPAVAYEPKYGGWLVSWAPGNWQASYWNNRNLAGPPVLERLEAQLGHQWGGGSPDDLVNADSFSARWTREIDVKEDASYTFKATSDEGMRVWVDDQRIIDHWWYHEVRTDLKRVDLSRGTHTVRVEYFDNTGLAVARLTWEPTDESNFALAYAPLSAAGEPLLLKTGHGPQATFQVISGTVPIDEHPSAQASACSPETTDYAQCALVASSGDRLYLQPLFLELVPALVGPITTTVVTSVTIDADPPTSTITSLVDGQSLAAGGTLVIGGDAADRTSGVARVQISVNGGPWQDTEGAESWAYAWRVPGSDGPVTLSTRATDLLGNTESAATITVIIDRTPPAVDLASGDIISATQRAGGWSLSFRGTVSDRYSDLDRVEVLVTPNGNGWQRAEVEGSGWQLAYGFSSLSSDGLPLPDPSGAYTVQLRAVDAAGNETPAPVERPLRVDATPPEVTVTYPTTATAAITATTPSLAGTIVDPGPVAAGVRSLEVSFTPPEAPPGRWLPAALDGQGRWHLPVPGDLEGMFQIDLRATDVLGNSSDHPSGWDQWRGEIDTLQPRAAITATVHGAGQAAQTVYEGWAEDLNLAAEGLEFPCKIEAADVHYYDDAWWTELAGDTRRLYRLAPSCIVSGFKEEVPSIKACDVHGHCTTSNATVLTETVALASAVLTPAHESVFTSTEPISLTIGAFALSGLEALALRVNGVEERSFAFAAHPADTITTTIWTPPPGGGQYVLVTEATDVSGTVQTDLQPITITIDVEGPSVDLVPTVLTTTHRLSFRSVSLGGTVSDTMGLEEVAVSVDEGPWQAARVDGEAWRYPWFLGPGEAEADGETHTVTVRAADAAGHTTVVTRPVTVDLVPPEPVTVTLAYDAGGGPVPLAVGQTIDEVNATLIMSWTESRDGAGPVETLAGWSTAITPLVQALAPAEGTYSRELSGTQVLVAHLLLRDLSGNSRVQTAGPVYLDAPGTPDLIGDLDYHGWLEGGCTQIGADREMARHALPGAYLAATQSLHATWDREALRLAWTGADWSISGDLFLYLDTRAGEGATTAYDPYGSGPAIGLPQGMGADILIWVEDEGPAALLTWDKLSGWSDPAGNVLDETQFRLDAGRARTDLLLPFSQLGIEPGASLSLLALASEEDALRLWATVPDENPLNSELAVNPLALDDLGQDFALTQRARLSLGDGQCPQRDLSGNADLRVSLSAEPPGLALGFLEHDLPGLLIAGQPLDGDLDGVPDASLPVAGASTPVGHGQRVTYTLRYENLGPGVEPGAVVTLTTRGALQLAAGPSVTVPLEAVSGTLTITGTIDTGLDRESAELDVEVGSASRGAFDWLWVQHAVDTAPPAGLQILAPAAAAGTGWNQASGLVSDASGVPSLTLEVRVVEPPQLAGLAGAATAQPTATLEVQPGGAITSCTDIRLRGGTWAYTCPDTTPRDGTWACTWCAGSAVDGTQIRLRARAADSFGTAGEWTSPITITVDATPPAVTLSDETTAALRGDALLGPADLWLSGQVRDEHQASAVQVCAAAPGDRLPYCELHATTAAGSPGTGDWQAPAPFLAGSDGVTQTFSFYGYDSVGNRSEPVTATARVDVVPPVVEATPAAGQVVQGMSSTILAGTVHDGSGIERLQAYVAGPGIQVAWYDQGDPQLEFDGEAWHLDVRFGEPGTYRLGLEAWDAAGNVGRGGPFAVEVRPATAGLSLTLSASPQTATGGSPLFYTAQVVNDGPDAASNTVLTLTLPAEVRLQQTLPGCNQDTRALVCSLGELGAGERDSIRLEVKVPFAVARTLVCQAAAGSATHDPDLGDNRRSLVTPIRPYPPDASLVCDGPNLLRNGGFEQGFQSNGVARSWAAFDNGGGAKFSYNSDAWAPVVSEGKYSQLLRIDTIDIAGPTQIDRISGIYQTVRLLPGYIYEMSVDAMMRERTEQPREDPYRKMVGWGYSRNGGTDLAAASFSQWLPLHDVNPMFQPGKMQSYRTRFEAPSRDVTIWLYAIKKWATLGRELNVNLDNATLRICRPVTVGTVPPR